MSRKYRRGARRRKHDRAEPAVGAMTAPAPRAEVFSFGDPVEVMDRTRSFNDAPQRLRPADILQGMRSA